MLYVNTNFAIDHFVSKITWIIGRKIRCRLQSPREFKLFIGRSFYTFLLVQKPHVTSLAKNVWFVDTRPRDTVNLTWRQSRPSCVYSRRKKKNWSPPRRHLFECPGLFSILLFLPFLWDSFTAMFAFCFTGCDFQLTYGPCF